MDAKIIEMLDKRRQQFYDFLNKILPESKKGLANTFKALSNQEFIMLFKNMIIPVEHNPDLIMKMVEEQYSLSQKDFKPEDIDILKKYMICFCEFIKAIV